MKENGKLEKEVKEPIYKKNVVLDDYCIYYTYCWGFIQPVG